MHESSAGQERESHDRPKVRLDLLPPGSPRVEHPEPLLVQTTVGAVGLRQSKALVEPREQFRGARPVLQDRERELLAELDPVGQGLDAGDLLVRQGHQAGQASDEHRIALAGGHQPEPGRRIGHPLQPVVPPAGHGVVIGQVVVDHRDRPVQMVLHGSHTARSPGHEHRSVHRHVRHRERGELFPFRGLRQIDQHVDLPVLEAFEQDPERCRLDRGSESGVPGHGVPEFGGETIRGAIAFHQGERREIQLASHRQVCGHRGGRRDPVGRGGARCRRREPRQRDTAADMSEVPYRAGRGCHSCDARQASNRRQSIPIDPVAKECRTDRGGRRVSASRLCSTGLQPGVPRGPAALLRVGGTADLRAVPGAEKPGRRQKGSHPDAAHTRDSPELKLPKLAWSASLIYKLLKSQTISYYKHRNHSATRHDRICPGPLQIGARRHSRGRLHPRCRATVHRPGFSQDRFAPFRDRLLRRAAGTCSCAVHAGHLFFARRAPLLADQPAPPRRIVLLGHPSTGHRHAARRQVRVEVLVEGPEHRSYFFKSNRKKSCVRSRGEHVFAGIGWRSADPMV